MPLVNFIALKEGRPQVVGRVRPLFFLAQEKFNNICEQFNLAHHSAPPAPQLVFRR